MEPFENNDLELEPELDAESLPEEEVVEEKMEEEEIQEKSTGYRGAGTGRKESPYANSPYRMSDPEPEYAYYPRTESVPKAKKARKAPKKWRKILLGTAAAVALAGSAVLATASVMGEYYEEKMESTMDRYSKEISQLQAQIDGLSANRVSAIGVPGENGAMTPAQLYASSVNSVVAISTRIQQNGYYGATEASSAGSGFILSEDGYIITNYHVVEDATAIEVITHDGTEYTAALVGYDSTNDLAVLDVEAENLPTAPLGSSTELVIGDMVVAIGNPLGELASTQTVGYVSGIDREVSTDGLTTINMIQTDAAINPGNSGGPLFNMHGEVIGITTAKYSGSTIEGIGFAIPIDDVEPLIGDLIDYGYVTGAYMGVSVQNTDAAAAAQFDLPLGAYIAGVEAGGAADRAGIRAKDIVIGLDQYEISNVTDLTRALRNYKAGDTATVKLIRSGRELQLEITFDEKPQQTAPAETQPRQETQPSQQMPYGDSFEDFFRRFFGN